MRMRTPALSLTVLAFALLTGCGENVLPSSALPTDLPTNTVPTTVSSAPDAPTNEVTPGTPPTGTPGPSAPFKVVGTVRMDVGQGTDARKSFNDCQHAAIQHAADTLDPSFDPTHLCVRRKGTSCSGIGDYRGLHAGAVVRITDPTGKTVGTGHLKRGTLNRPLTLMGAKPLCVFPFTVSSVTGGLPGYVVAVGPARASFAQSAAGNVVVAVHDE